MLAGKMDQRITLKSLTNETDALGAVIETWATLDTVWAEAKDLTGREFVAAAQVNAEVSARFRIRYRTDVTPEMRIGWSGREYDIKSISMLGRKDGLEIMASARA